MSSNERDEAQHQKSIVYGGNIYDIWIGSFVGLIAILFVVAYLVWSGSKTDHWWLAMLGVVGGLVGWALGIVATPYNESEKGRLGQIMSAVAAFGSGVFVAKVDLTGKLSLDAPLTITTITPLMEMVPIFLICVLAAFIVTYMQRSYTWAEAVKANKELTDGDAGI